MSDAPDCAWIDAGPETGFEPGAGRKIDSGDVPVAVFRDPEGGYVALTDRCPHAGAPLSAGMLRDGKVVCCWHGWTFEPGSGKCTSVPWAKPVGVHAVRVEGGRVYVDPIARASDPPPPSQGEDPGSGAATDASSA